MATTLAVFNQQDAVENSSLDKGNKPECFLRFQLEYQLLRDALFNGLYCLVVTQLQAIISRFGNIGC